MNISLLLFLLLVGIIYKSQEKALLFGKKIPFNWLPTIEYPYEEFFVEMLQDKKVIKLNAVLFKASNNPNNKVVIYYHGNRGNVDTVQEYAISYLENGYDVFVMDYRGFGKSQGIINTPEVLLGDALFWYDWLEEKKGYQNIVILGKSLGSGLATYVASQRKCNMLMLITPYDKLIEVGKNKYPWVPIGFLMKYKIPSVNWLEKIKVPIRIIHGTKDETIAPQRADNFYNKAKELNLDVEIVWLQAAKHNNLQMYPKYHEWIKSCLIKAETDF